MKFLKHMKRYSAIPLGFAFFLKVPALKIDEMKHSIFNMMGDKFFNVLNFHSFLVINS